MAELNTVEEAIRVLEDGSRTEQTEALSSLEERSHTEPEVLVPHLDSICPFAGDEEMGVREDVATILGNVAAYEPSAVLPYTDVVCTLISDDIPHILSVAMRAAARIARESPTELLAVTERLFELLTYENIADSLGARIVRSRAVIALGYLGEVDPDIAARADEPLTDRLDDETRNVRWATVSSLTRLGLAHPETIPTGLAHLSTCLDDPDANVRHEAINAYIQFRHNQPTAISQPGEVAPAFKRTAEQAGPELDETEKKAIVETYRYLNKMAADGG